VRERRHRRRRRESLTVAGCGAQSEQDSSAQMLQDETHFVAAAIVKFVKLLQARPFAV
jgi:hypothetical protein